MFTNADDFKVHQHWRVVTVCNSIEKKLVTCNSIEKKLPGLLNWSNENSLIFDETGRRLMLLTTTKMAKCHNLNILKHLKIKRIENNWSL